GDAGFTGPAGVFVGMCAPGSGGEYGRPPVDDRRQREAGGSEHVRGLGIIGWEGDAGEADNAHVRKSQRAKANQSAHLREVLFEGCSKATHGNAGISCANARANYKKEAVLR